MSALIYSVFVDLRRRRRFTSQVNIIFRKAISVIECMCALSKSRFNYGVNVRVSMSVSMILFHERPVVMAGRLAHLLVLLMAGANPNYLREWDQKVPLLMPVSWLLAAPGLTQQDIFCVSLWIHIWCEQCMLFSRPLHKLRTINFEAFIRDTNTAAVASAHGYS